MDSFDADRIGQGGILLGAGTVPRPAGLLGPGPSGDPYPVYRDGDGVGVGSASETARAGGRCCGASLGASSAAARSPQAAPLFTGSAFEDAAPSRGDLFANPSAPAAPALELPAPGSGGGAPARPPAPGEPGRIARSLFSVPPDCADAPCEAVVRARDWMVRFVRTGATWPVIPRTGS